MYYTIRRIYIKTHEAHYVESAFKKGWITEAEKNKILSIEFPEN